MASIQTRTGPRGTTYAVLYRLHGKQTSTTRDTLKDAQAVKALIDAKGAETALRLLAAEETGGGITVGELAEKWLEWKRPPKITERTWRDYRRDVDNWILPWFGDHAAELVDEGDVQDWIDEIAPRLDAKTVGDKHMLLHSIYKYGRAKSRRLVSHNPCEETELPKKTRKPPKGTTVAEFEAIRAAAWKRNKDAHDLILFLGETGWRFSEATALDVRDVADDGTDVWVTVTQVFRIDGNGRQVITPDAAKSHAAFRRIRLFPDSAAMVRRRLLGKRPGDLEFTNSRGRHWNQHTFLRETWPAIMEDAGFITLERPTAPAPLGERATAAEVRAWARSEGLEVNKRGRIDPLVYRFNQHHKGKKFYAPPGWGAEALGVPVFDMDEPRGTARTRARPKRTQIPTGVRYPTPHWLRHMHVAVCLAAGASLQEVQRRIGHENISTTVGTYGGMVGDINDQALDNAADIMAGRRFAHGVAPIVRAQVVRELEG